jgi:hypothetical protein
MKSEATANVYLELAKVHLKKKSYEEAVSYQKKALGMPSLLI